MSRADTHDDYAIRAAVEGQAHVTDADSIASQLPLAMLTEADLLGEDFAEWKRRTLAELDEVDAIFKEKFGMTTDELCRYMGDVERRQNVRKKGPKRRS
jgi:hypothetical protein